MRSLGLDDAGGFVGEDLELAGGDRVCGLTGDVARVCFLLLPGDTIELRGPIGGYFV